MNIDERDDALHELSRTPDLLQQLILDTDADKLDYAPPREWSIRTILAHLLSIEWQVMRLRLERMLAENDPVLASYDEKVWAAEYNKQPSASISKTVTDFTIQRQASIRLIENLRAGDWARTAYHPERGRIDVEWLVGYWAVHDQIHLNQITQLLGELGA